MRIKQLVEEDFVNYRKPAMFVGFPSCSFKCEKECGVKCCQNSELAKAATYEIDTDKLISRYLSNDITKAIVCGGLEPFDSWTELTDFIKKFRRVSNDDIVIYTGYKEEELTEQIEWLEFYPNIIVKFGRFIPNQEKHYDEVLGVYLASSNQYAKKI
jgi:organic radical activating enzyme